MGLDHAEGCELHLATLLWETDLPSMDPKLEADGLGRLGAALMPTDALLETLLSVATPSVLRVLTPPDGGASDSPR